MRKYLIPLVCLFALSACDYKAKSVCEQGQRLVKKSVAEGILGRFFVNYMIPTTDQDVDVASGLIQGELISAKEGEAPDQYYCVSKVEFKRGDVIMGIPTMSGLNEKDKQEFAKKFAEMRPTTLLIEYKAQVIGDFIKVNIVGVTEVK